MEDQYDAIGAHTDFYLQTLGQYLEHLNGRKVTYVGQPSSFGRNHFGGVVGMSADVFVEGVDAAASEAALKAWLDDVYR